MAFPLRQAVQRHHRPVNYNAVIGQQEIKDLLCRQLEEGHVPHAQLFCGPEGSGKLPMAMAFASALLCHAPEGGNACGKCPGCKMTAKFAHPDLHFVFPVIRRKGQSGEAVSDQYLKDWREQIHESPYFDLLTWLSRIGVENQQPLIGVAESDEILRKLSIKAGQGGYKVMIIWLPELMNQAAANKLLKILEEPPAETVFLLVSDRPERLLSTIVSRTRRVAFRPLGTEETAEALTTRNALEPEEARAVARLSAGNYVKALQQIHFNEDKALFFDMFVLLMRLSYMRKIKEMHEWSERVAAWGRERQKNFLEYAQRLIRENFIHNFHRPELNYMNREEAEFSRKFARFINERNVFGIMDELSLAQRDIEHNVNPRMVFFDFSLKIIVLLIQ